MRESLKEYEFSEEILKITITKMNFYSEYFGYLFPFNGKLMIKKYDQIFCPEYICGAIENVALVIIKKKSTQRY
jgi:aminopeptidase N